MNSSTNSASRRSRPLAEEELLLTEINGASLTPSRNGTTGRQGIDRRITEPVKLTPAWEGKNLPNDVLNFKGVTMEQADLETNPPKDRFKMVYIILLIHGIGVLMPWNMFINAKSYFVDYKLGANYTGVSNTQYTNNFLPYIGVASQAPNFICAWLNIFIQFGGNLTSRIVWTIGIESVLFVATVVLAIVDTSTWPDIFFWATLSIVFVINAASGIYQNSIFGLAAKLPSKYTGAVILGNNVSGTFTSIISIMSHILSPDAKRAGIYYFVTALFVLLVCFDTYFALPINRFYKYHDLIHEKEKASNAKQTITGSRKIPYGRIFSQCFPQCLNVFVVFFVTLNIFPALYSDIKRRSNSDFFIKDETLFVDVTCFLTFNLFAMFGNMFASVFVWPGPRTVFIPVFLRFLFIPLFLVLNYYPKGGRIMPVLIDDEWITWIFGMLLALTSGYYSSLTMMYCPRTVEPQYSTVAGMFGAASLVTGIASGVLSSAINPWIVQNVTW